MNDHQLKLSVFTAILMAVIYLCCGCTDPCAVGDCPIEPDPVDTTSTEPTVSCSIPCVNGTVDSVSCICICNTGFFGDACDSLRVITPPPPPPPPPDFELSVFPTVIDYGSVCMGKNRKNSVLLSNKTDSAIAVTLINCSRKSCFRINGKGVEELKITIPPHSSEEIILGFYHPGPPIGPIGFSFPPCLGDFSCELKIKAESVGLTKNYNIIQNGRGLPANAAGC